MIRSLIEFELAVADVNSRVDQNRPKTFGVPAGRPQIRERMKAIANERRRFRMFNVIDDCTRECQVLIVATCQAGLAKCCV